LAASTREHRELLAKQAQKLFNDFKIYTNKVQHFSDQLKSVVYGLDLCPAMFAHS
jgi:CRISPR/Cas system CMR-associated protein Cmr5 small subunit